MCRNDTETEVVETWRKVLLKVALKRYYSVTLNLIKLIHEQDFRKRASVWADLFLICNPRYIQ